MSLLRLSGRYIRRAVRSFDYDIIRYDSRSLSWWRTQVFRRNHIGLVIDVGANAGQTGRQLRSEGYSGRIVSFEPSSAAFALLVAAARSDPRWHAERAALGSQDGTVTLNVSGNSESSSVLQMLDRHVRSAPASRYVQTEQVPLRRLDSFRETLALTTEPSLLKLDVQGYEDQVLKELRRRSRPSMRSNVNYLSPPCTRANQAERDGRDASRARLRARRSSPSIH